MRGPQHHFAWADEIAKWPQATAVWDTLAMGLRLGRTPRTVATTSPRPTPLVRRLVRAEAGVAVTRGRMVDNRSALAPSFIATMRDLYGRTLIARQELDGELIETVEGALWSRDLVERTRVNEPPPRDRWRRCVVGVDPPAGASASSDACGIVAAVLVDDGHAYVLADASIQGASPERWARAVGAGWRRASVSLSLDGGTSWQIAGQTAMPATIGSAASALGGGSAMLFDRVGAVDVELLHAGMSLAGADDAALVAGANLAMLGGELLQFGAARQLSPTRWRLSGLVRGRRGTEWATAGHVVGERFVLIEAATLLALSVPLTALGSPLLLSAIGPGDAGAAVSASAPVVGRAVRPPSPVRLQASRRSDGTIDLAWTWRSRRGWAWLDGGDVPLAEDAERYRLALTPTAGATRTMDMAAPAYSYTPAAQAADGAGGATGLRAAVVQLGTDAASETAATASWTW